MDNLFKLPNLDFNALRPVSASELFTKVIQGQIQQL
jgi:hypothetical protein